MKELINQPEYIHVLLNPVITHVLPIAALLLGVAMILKGRALLVTSLTLVAVSALWAWPVVKYGQATYDLIHEEVDPVTGDWLEVHMERAETWEPLFIATGLFAVAALVACWRWPRWSKWLSSLALVLALISSGVGGYIGYAGGKIRHEEFRVGAPPAHDVIEGETHEHGHEHEHEHGHDHSH